MKTLITSMAIIIATATATLAGNLAYVAPEVTMIEEPTTMGGSGSWLIPLVIIAVLILALTGGEEEVTEVTAL